MRSRDVRVLAVALAGLLAVAAAPLESGSDAGATGTQASVGFSSGNVEWVDVNPLHTGTAGGVVHGDRYYVTDPRGVYVYDVAAPEQPELLGFLTAAQMGLSAVLAQEDPDTNGEILLVDAANPDEPSASAELLVVDVSEPEEMSVLASVDSTAHTWECVLDCTYAYGRDGDVIDLTDPESPKVATNWRGHVEGDDYMHDFNEVAPGRVLGAGQPSFYLDVDKATGEPAVLARIDSDFHSLGHHHAGWPNGATDPLMLMGAEVAPSGATNLAGSDCSDESTYAVATFDATAVREVDERQFNARNPQAHRRGDKDGHAAQREGAGFAKLAEWRVDGRGAYVDGNPPAHTLFCGHWFDPHPTWDDGGVLAVAHYDWGTRFVDVAGVEDGGEMEEIGWFVPAGGYTGSVTWVSDEIVYVHDYRRGLDILRVTGAGG